jgi:hypothetical protein
LTPGDALQTNEPLCITQGGFFVPANRKQTGNGENNYLPAKRGFLRVFDATKPETNRKLSGKGDRTHGYKTKKGGRNVNR